jgi:hypothetical protein
VKRLAAFGLALAALLARSGASAAETKRFAVLVASNAGSRLQPALHFAEDDADRFATVLRELGSLEREDIWVLKGTSARRVVAALDEAARRVAAWRTRPDRSAVVVFYFSGHSDGEALELGDDRLAFSEVRRLLVKTGADVRLTVLDSCRSGALIAVKGGTPSTGFEVHLSDNLASAGEAFITSSAADESALESSEIHGSFFSHHLISGLRGAADVSGDGQVTLAEAYQYAYAHTVRATSNTMVGPQHPVYDYRLSGRGDLVLTHLDAASALIETPSGFERLLLIDARRSEVLVELGSQAARRVAVPAGRYLLRGWRAGRMLATEIEVGTGERRLVASEELTPVDAVAGVRKGGGGGPAVAGAPPSAARTSLLIGLGVEGPVAASLDVLPALRLSLARPERRAPTLTLDLASGGGAGFRESRFEVLAGGRQLWTAGRWQLGAGFEAGGGLAVQQIGGEPARSTGLITVAATASAGVALMPSLTVTLAAQAPATLLRLDGRSTVGWRPAGWLGISVPH